MEGPGAHAVKPLVPLAPATVVKHRTVEWYDCLRRGDHELAVQEVLAIGPSEGEVGSVARLVLGLVLTNLYVGGACRDLHYVSVTLTVWQKRKTLNKLNDVLMNMFLPSLNSPSHDEFACHLIIIISRYIKHVSLSLPLFSEVACYTYTSCAVTSTYTTLVELQLGANDAVTACSYTFALHTH